MLLHTSEVELTVVEDVSPSEDAQEAVVVAVFTLGEIIAESDNATIYDAGRDGLETKLAFKSFQQALSGEAQERFEQVATLAKSLDHPNIASVFSYGIADDGCAFVVYEKAVGKPLQSVIAETGALNAVTLVSVFCQVADAVEYALSKGAWVAELAPEQIFVSGLDMGAPTVKVVGIGISRNAFEQDVSARSLIAQGEAARYASPERCLGKDLDERSLVYAIGCMLHEAVYGVPAFAEKDHIKLLFDHVNAGDFRRYPRARTGLDKFERCVSKCLGTKPESRHQKLSSLRHQLENIDDPVKSEADASPFHLLLMQWSGARTPMGGEVYLLAIFAIFVVMTNAVMTKYGRECTALQKRIDKMTQADQPADAEDMIRKWKKIQLDGLMLGQSQTFEADCDMRIGSYLMQRGDRTQAFERYKRAARSYRYNGLKSEAITALDKAIALYSGSGFTLDSAYSPVEVNPEFAANAEKLRPLMCDRIMLLERVSPNDKFSLSDAWHQLADLDMSSNRTGWAVQELLTCVNRFADNTGPWTYWRLGECMKRQSQAAKAEYWYRRALSTDFLFDHHRRAIEVALNDVLAQQGKPTVALIKPPSSPPDAFASSGF
jgi:tetratricopeptide (TPR) repeat protein